MLIDHKAINRPEYRDEAITIIDLLNITVFRDQTLISRSGGLSYSLVYNIDYRTDKLSHCICWLDVLSANKGFQFELQTNNLIRKRRVHSMRFRRYDWCRLAASLCGDNLLKASNKEKFISLSAWIKKSRFGLICAFPPFNYTISKFVVKLWKYMWLWYLYIAYRPGNRIYWIKVGKSYLTLRNLFKFHVSQ